MLPDDTGLPLHMESEDEAEARSPGDWYQVIRDHVATVDVYHRTDAVAVSHLARALYDFHQARAKLRETGGPVITGTKGVPVTNPWLRAQNTFSEKVSSLLVKVGLTPQSRQKLQQVPAHHQGPKQPHRRG